MQQKTIIFLIVGLLLTIVLFWLIRILTRNRIGKNQIFQQQIYDALRAQVGKDLHDELGSRLAAMQWFGAMLQQPLTKGQQLQYARKIETLANETYLGLKDLLWVLDPGKDSWQDLLTFLREAGEGLFLGDLIHFEYTQSLSVDRLNMRLSPEAQRHLLLLFKEAMTNVLRHAEASEVHLSWIETASHLIATLWDNGQPAKAPSTQGKGLQNMKYRAEAIGAQLTLYRESDGTRVQLTWPLEASQRQHFLEGLVLAIKTKHSPA